MYVSSAFDFHECSRPLFTAKLFKNKSNVLTHFYGPWWSTGRNVSFVYFIRRRVRTGMLRVTFLKARVRALRGIAEAVTTATSTRRSAATGARWSPASSTRLRTPIDTRRSPTAGAAIRPTLTDTRRITHATSPRRCRRNTSAAIVWHPWKTSMSLSQFFWALQLN